MPHSGYVERFPPFLCVLSLELCLMDRVSFEAEPVGLNPLPFPQPVQPVSGHLASRLSGAQKRPPWGKELAIQAFPEVGFLRRWPLSPFPPLLPYIALTHSLPSELRNDIRTQAKPPIQAGLPAGLPVCAKRGKAALGDRASAEKGALLCMLGRLGKRRLFLSLAATESSGGVMDFFLPFGRDSSEVAFS